MIAHSHSSRFDGSAIGALHARHALAEDITRGVCIGMVDMAAASADEGRLVLAAPSIDHATFGARLGCVGGVAVDDLAAPLGQFVVKDGGERMPALIEDRAIETGLLADVAARFLYRTSSGRGHVADLQLLHRDRAEAPRNIDRDAVMPILADAGDPGADTTYTAELLGASIRSPLTTGKDTLFASLGLVECDQAGGNAEMLASGQAKRIGNAAIDPDRRANVGGRFVIDLAREGNEPLIGDKRDGEGFYDAVNLACGAVLYHPDLGNAARRPFCIDSYEASVAPFKLSGIINPPHARCRVASGAIKKSGIRFIQIPDGLLKNYRGRRRKPVNTFPEFREFGALGYPADGAPRCGIKLSPPISALFQTKIVDISCRADELAQCRFLLGRRIKPVAKRSIDHRYFVATSATERKL